MPRHLPTTAPRPADADPRGAGCGADAASRARWAEPWGFFLSGEGGFQLHRRAGRSARALFARTLAGHRGRDRVAHAGPAGEKIRFTVSLENDAGETFATESHTLAPAARRAWRSAFRPRPAAIAPSWRPKWSRARPATPMPGRGSWARLQLKPAPARPVRSSIPARSLGRGWRPAPPWSAGSRHRCGSPPRTGPSPQGNRG